MKKNTKMKTAINIKGLKENTTIKELNEMEKSLRKFPELKQIKEKGINNNREVRNGKESTKDLFKSLGVEHYD